MKNNKPELDKQLFWFQGFKALPYILVAATFIVFFALGIADAVNELWFIDIESGFLIWFVWFLIGIIGSLIMFAISRIIMSPKILEVYYLQKCAGEKDKLVLQEEIAASQEQRQEK